MLKFYFISGENFSVQKSAISLGFLSNSLFVSSLSDVFFRKISGSVKKDLKAINRFEFDKNVILLLKDYLSFLPYDKKIYVHEWKYKKNSNNYVDWSRKNNLSNIGKNTDYYGYDDIYAELAVPVFWSDFWEKILSKLKSKEEKILFFEKYNFIPIFIDGSAHDYYEQMNYYDNLRNHNDEEDEEDEDYDYDEDYDGFDYDEAYEED